MELLKQYDFDSMSFIDTEYDLPAVSNAVHEMISNEMRNFTPPNYIASFNYPKLKFSNSPALQAEWKRVTTSSGSSRMANQLDLARSQLRAPDAALEKDPQAWSTAVNNAKVQFEHNQSSAINLELAADHLGSDWLQYNKYLEHAQSLVDKDIFIKKRKLDEIQSQRRNFQNDVYSELQRCKSLGEGSIKKQVQIIEYCRHALRDNPDILEQFEEIVNSSSIKGTVDASAVSSGNSNISSSSNSQGLNMEEGEDGAHSTALDHSSGSSNNNSSSNYSNSSMEDVDS